MNFKNQSFARSIWNALKGLKWAMKTERNLKIQLGMLGLITILGWFLKFSSVDWVMIILASALVIITEMINTAIEITVDMFCHNEFNILAKKAKDIAAGAVLIGSITSVIIGAIVIIPKLINMIR